MGAIDVAHDFDRLVAVHCCLAALSCVFEDVVHFEAFVLLLSVSWLLLSALEHYFLLL